MGKQKSPSRREHDFCKHLKECMICGAKNRAVSAELISKNRQSAACLYHVRCRRCQHALLTMVHDDGRGLSSVGFFTDLSAADTRRLRAHPESIEPEAIMEVHTLLQEKRFFGIIERKLN